VLKNGAAKSTRVPDADSGGLWLAEAFGQRGSDVLTKFSGKFKEVLKLLTTMAVAFSGHAGDADNRGSVVLSAMPGKGSAIG
jgi:hypothetical protein